MCNRCCLLTTAQPYAECSAARARCGGGGQRTPRATWLYSERVQQRTRQSTARRPLNSTMSPSWTNRSASTWRTGIAPWNETRSSASRAWIAESVVCRRNDGGPEEPSDGSDGIRSARAASIKAAQGGRSSAGRHCRCTGAHEVRNYVYCTRPPATCRLVHTRSVETMHLIIMLQSTAGSRQPVTSRSFQLGGESGSRQHDAAAQSVHQYSSSSSRQSQSAAAAAGSESAGRRSIPQTFLSKRAIGDRMLSL